MIALQYALVALAISITVVWLLYAVTASKNLDSPKALEVLRYGPLLRSAALFLAVGPPVVMGCVIGLSSWKAIDQLLLAGGSFLLTSVAGGFLLLEVEGVQIVLTEDGLTRHARWRREVSISWTEVDRVGYSGLNRWFVVWASDRAICVSRYLIGIRAFVELAQRKVSKERCTAAAAAMERV